MDSTIKTLIGGKTNILSHAQITKKSRTDCFLVEPFVTRTKGDISCKRQLIGFTPKNVMLKTIENPANILIAVQKSFLLPLFPSFPIEGPNRTRIRIE